MIDLLAHFQKEIMILDRFLTRLTFFLEYGYAFPFADLIMKPVISYLFSIIILSISIIMTTLLIRATINFCGLYSSPGLLSTLARLLALIFAMFADFLLALGMTVFILIVVDHVYYLFAIANEWASIGSFPSTIQIQDYIYYFFILLDVDPNMIENHLAVMRSDFCHIIEVDCELLRESLIVQRQLENKASGLLDYLFFHEVLLSRTFPDFDRWISSLGLGFLDDPLISRGELLFYFVRNDFSIIFKDGIHGVIDNYRLVDFDSALRNWVLAFSVLPLILHGVVILVGFCIFFIELSLVIVWRPFVLILEKEGLFKTLGAYSIFLIAVALYIFG